MTELTSLNWEEQPYSELADFILKYLPQHKKSTIISYLKSHDEYKTLDYFKDSKGFVYCMRYNISPSGRICHVLDLCVREGDRNKNLIKFIIARNWHRWPTLKYFSFERGLKYKNRKPRLYVISKIFKGVNQIG